MDKEIIRDAVEILNESIMMQKEAMLLLDANGIVITDVSPKMKCVQIHSGIERLAAVLGYTLIGCSFNEKHSAFLLDGIEYFELAKGEENDLSVE